MKPTAIIFSVGFVATLCGACDLSAPPAVPAPAPALAPGRVAACQFDPNKVVGLLTFDANNNGGCDDNFRPNCYRAPTDSGPIGSSYANDIVAAFTIAPPFFQRQLCALNKIYIDTNPSSQNPVAWGLHERRGVQGNNDIIGISSRVWTDPSMNSSAPAQEAYLPYEETFILNALLTPLPPNAAQWMQGFKYQSAVPDSRAIEILAILAHEMGHITWWSKKNELNRPCSTMNDTFFYRYSWRNRGNISAFHRFGIQDPNNKPIDLPDRADVLLDLQNGSSPYPKAVSDLQKVYNGNWASLFATVASDEDFIEAYKLLVLTDQSGQQPLTSLKVVIPSVQAIDVIALSQNPLTKLYNKIQWIKSCLAL